MKLGSFNEMENKKKKIEMEARWKRGRAVEVKLTN
jgi:hypothetical protein